MRAVQVVAPTGPAGIEIRDVDEPTPGPDDVLIEVHRVGVSFPDLLLSRGEYQLKPDPPFSLGVDVSGTVVSGAGFEPGQRVAGVFGVRRGAGTRRDPGDVHVRAARRDLVRRGRGAADELPHRPVRPRRAGRAGARRDGARARRRGRGRHRHPPGGARHGSPHHRGRQHRREGRGGPGGRRRRGGAGRRVQGRRQGAHRGQRRRRGARRGGWGPLHRLVALALDPGPATRRRLRLRPGDPGGEGQPAVAQQRRRAGRRMGRVRDDAASCGPSPSGSPGAQPRGCGWYSGRGRSARGSAAVRRPARPR